MQTDSLLGDFFQSGFIPHELPGVAGLLRARHFLDAFITLFRGGDDEVLVRLLVLREIGTRADAPRWSRKELDQHFSYLNPIKLDTVLKRLSENNLLIWDGDEQLYDLAETGRVALAALSTLVQFADGDAELGYLTAQVAAGQSMGRISHEALQHLLARLNELYRVFEEALESQSEFQIRGAQQKLDSVWQWVQKGTEVMHMILQDEALDLATLNQAQAIAYAQSRMLRLTGVFQRRLSELAAQRVHLGQSGLTSSNVADWLRAQTQEALAALGNDLLSFHPEPLFVTSDEMLDVAEFELIERDRPEQQLSGLPASHAAPLTSELEAERLLEAEALHAFLDQLPAQSSLAEAVLAETYKQTAYRMSLLALLGDAEAAMEASIVADLVRLPLRLETEDALDYPDHPEVAAISRGTLNRTRNPG